MCCIRFVKIPWWVFLAWAVCIYEDVPAQNTEEGIAGEQLQDISGELSEARTELAFRMHERLDIMTFLSDQELYGAYLTPSQRDHLLQHIRYAGVPLDMLELQVIEGFSEKEYDALRKLIYIDPAQPSEGKALYLSHRTVTSSPKEPSHLGPGYSSYQRMRMKTNREFGLGFSRERDAGEPFSSRPAAFADHSAWYFWKRHRKAAGILGHYQLFFGQGLLFGQGFSNSGMSEITSIAHIGSGFSPAAGNEENNSLFGGQVDVRTRAGTYQYAYSNTMKDQGTHTGYHRTVSEIGRKDRVKEEVHLMSWSRKVGRTELSALIVRGEGHSGWSAGLNTYYEGSVLFGELSVYNNRKAYCTGIMLMPSRNLRISGSYTSFEDKYDPPWMSASVLNTDPRDAAGIGISALLEPSRTWKLSYSHQYRTGQRTDDDKVFAERKFRQDLRISRVMKHKQQLNITISRQSATEKLSSGSIRSRAKWQVPYDDRFTGILQLYHYRDAGSRSSCLSYQLRLKHRRFAYSYSIAFASVSKGLMIYYSEANPMSAMQQSVISSSGYVSTLSMRAKMMRKIRMNAALTSGQQQERPRSIRIQLSISYP